MLRVMIDPGTVTHGLVVANMDGKRVIHADAAATTGLVRETLRKMPKSLVLIERIQAHGIAGNAVIRTCEHSADFRAVARESGHQVVWLYRRHIKKVLDVQGGNADSIVRARMRSEFGEEAWQTSKVCPKRKNKSHGDGCPICGGTGLAREAGWLSSLTGHAVQALALSAAYDLGARDVVHD